MADIKGNGASSALAVELTAALDATAGAWEGWNTADDRTRGLYAAWVGQARRARTRQERATTTAYHAANGTLRYAIRRITDTDSDDVVEGAAGVAGLAGRLVRALGNLIN